MTIEEDGNITITNIKKIISALPYIVIVLDPDYVIRYANTRYADMLGLEHESLIGKTLGEVGRPKEFIAMVEAYIKEVITTKKTVIADRRHQTLGGLIDYEMNLSPIFNDGGDVELITVSALDVTGTRQAQIDTLESRRQVLDILESISDGFFALDSLFRVTYINNRAQGLLGLSKEDVLFKNIWQKLPNAQLLHLYKMLHDSSEKKKVISFSESFPNLNKWFEFHIYPYESGISVYFSDTTERTRAEQEREQAHKRLQMLHEITNIATSSLNMSEISSRILDALAQRVDLTIAEIFIHDKGKSELVATYLYGLPQDFLDMIPAVKTDSDYESSKVFSSGKPIVVEDIASQTVTSLVREGLQKIKTITGIGIKSYLVLPLISYNETIGVMVLAWGEPRIFKQQELELFTSVAYELAAGLENARLYSQEREQSRLNEALNDLNAIIHSSLNYDEIMQQALITGAKAIGAETGAISLYQEGHFIVEYIYNWPESIVGNRISDEQEAHGTLALKTGETVAINDTRNDLQVVRELMNEYGIKSVIAAPLIVKDEGIAVLYYNFNSSWHIFTQSEIDFVTKLASTLTLALENARLFEAEQSYRRKEETRRKRLEFLYEITNIAISSLDTHEVAQRTIDSLSTEFGSTVGGIYIINETHTKLLPLASYGYPVDFWESMPPILVNSPNENPQVFVTGKPCVVEDADADDVSPTTKTDIKRLNESIDAAIKSYIMLPLCGRKGNIGTINIAWPYAQKFAKEDIDFFTAVSNGIAVGLENARLYAIERNIADTLQEALFMLPERVYGLEFGYLYRSATEATKVGGDFIDLFELECNNVAVVVGDVSGKGLEAATITALVRNTLRAYANDEADPAVIMRKTNEVVKKATSDSYFVTLFLAIINPDTGSIRYCLAGHPPALLMRADTGIVKLNKQSPVIGAFAGLKYETGIEALKRGDTMLIYTDGITEARCEGGLFGEERLINILMLLNKTPTKNIPEVIFSEVLNCTGGKLNDDVALLSLSLKG